MKRKAKYSIGNKLARFGIFMLLSISIVIVCSDGWVEYEAKDKNYDSVEEVPYNKVGLVLGTSKYSVQGQNLFYRARIRAAVELFNAKKVDYLLISGDNGTKYYNEPKTIKQDLIANGIPSDRIVLDYAGFRTLDSVVRAKEVFQVEKMTIISQQFHNERALFIASTKDIRAVAFNADDVGGNRGLSVKVRERLARVNMMLDLLLGKNPKFLGDPIPIG